MTFARGSSRRPGSARAGLLLAWIAALAVAPRADAQATEVELPSPRSEYLGRRIAQTMHWRGADWLLRATRESEEHTARMLAALGVEPGDVVCDLGSGVGYLTLPLARLVGEQGRVIAVDIQAPMLERLEQRAREAGIANVDTVLGGAADPRLAPASCDLVLMVDVYHELGYPERVLARVREALKPDGRLVLVEFRAEDPEVPILPDHKMSKAQVERELSANGFAFRASFDELPWQHMLTFVRAPTETASEGVRGSQAGGASPGWPAMEQRSDRYGRAAGLAVLVGLVAGSSAWSACRSVRAGPSGASSESSIPTETVDAPPETSGRVRSHGDGELEDEQLAELEDARDGAWLYERNCSGCHGLTGAGDGLTAKELGVQPRNFNQGGFSFGNTREDLFRTISSGIPGRSVMPSFRGVLPDEDIRLIIDHVRTLMPPQDEQDARASVPAVGARPVVARGKLPPIAEGLPERPRGLLVGLPSGLTFEYDAEDVRLLGVRLGPFADREDWRSRGGGYLRPLGQVVWLHGGGDPSPCYIERGDGGEIPLRGELRSTRVLDDAVQVDFDLLDGDGRRRGAARETCRFVATSVGAAFERTVRLSDPGENRPQATRLAGSGEGRFELRGDPDGAHFWAVAPRADGSFECVRVDSRWGLETRPDGGLWVVMEVGPWRVLEARATVVLCADASDEKLAELAREIDR